MSTNCPPRPQGESIPSAPERRLTTPVQAIEVGRAVSVPCEHFAGTLCEAAKQGTYFSCGGVLSRVPREVTPASRVAEITA